jgi:membrane protease YdiL (CAAX protease family)
MSNPEARSLLLLILGLAVLVWGLASAVWIARNIIRQPGRILGPARFGADDPPGIFILIGLGAVIVGATIGAVVPVNAAGENMRLVIGTLYINLGIIVCFLLGNHFLRENGLRLVGLSPNQLGAGLRLGVIALAIVLPLVYLTSMAVDQINTWLKLPNPEAHTLLTMLDESRTPSRIALIYLLAAVVVPVAEEILFRGYLQTLVVRFFGWASAHNRPSPTGILPLNTPPVNIRTRWIAIIITSGLFALAHATPAFMPPLFVLSLALGYLYESTGNLWSNIILHACFNASQMTIVLYFGIV